MDLGVELKTPRLIIRPFREADMPALFMLLSDREVNRFLPWFPLKTEEEAFGFYKSHIAGSAYFFAICLKEDLYPVGYINVKSDESHDLGYALCRSLWHRGIAAEAGRALIPLLKKDGIPYITATHDRENPQSGSVMRKIGMRYQYSYEEFWQPKNIRVIFRLYQLNLDGNNERVYRAYWERSEVRFVEAIG